MKSPRAGALQRFRVPVKKSPPSVEPAGHLHLMTLPGADFTTSRGKLDTLEVETPDVPLLGRI
jgi:hypothetical protein